MYWVLNNKLSLYNSNGVESQFITYYNLENENE